MKWPVFYLVALLVGTFWLLLGCGPSAPKTITNQAVVSFSNNPNFSADQPYFWLGNFDTSVHPLGKGLYTATDSSLYNANYLFYQALAKRLSGQSLVLSAFNPDATDLIHVRNFPAGARLQITIEQAKAVDATATLTFVYQATASADSTVAWAWSLPRYDASANPYGVYTAEDLQAINLALTESYRQMQTITLPDLATGQASGLYDSGGWLPLGPNPQSSFMGSYDGQAFKITNLPIHRPQSNYQGLFGITYKGYIHQLWLEGARVAGQSQVGALVGWAQDSTISYSYVGGSVSSSNSVAGGLAGLVQDSTVYQSLADAELAGPAIMGGLVGRSMGGDYTNVYSIGTNAGKDVAGGLIAMNSGNIHYAYSASQLTGSGPTMGGLIAFNQGGRVDHGYYSGYNLDDSSATPIQALQGQYFPDFPFAQPTSKENWHNLANYLPQLNGLSAGTQRLVPLPAP